MVCSLGNGKMAVMARLLAEGSLSHIPSCKEKNGDVNKQKLAFQCIYRELRGADSPNLLDEEDMHVFGLTPMTDPLHLVCCNACRKPVKASQYAAHAELCRSLISTGEMLLQPSGGIGHRKPPRKDKKKSLSSFSNQAAPAGEQEQFESIDVDESAALESHFDGQSKLRSSFSMDTKRNSACVGVTSMMDGKGVNHENTNPSACVISPPTKRSKLVLNQNLSQSDDLEISSYLAGIESSQVFDPCRELHKQCASESDLCNGAVFVKSSQQAYESCQMARDVPVPIATKIYYSQRNNHLRSTIGNLYHTVSAKGPNDGVTCPDVSQEIKKEFQGHRGVSNDQKQDMLNKK
ncbi:hypothetical protein K2173_022446 [Erythroxylum novogranatense]|uniref:SAGA-associated factor 11 n=1 Tax=Erythroxylum novogranatense TaxID=1862640 RepID=A0AAV8THM9_9ROSI|nr:hypothetical protein K2173_022446 [Erythroxylum novogranatense]